MMSRREDKRKKCSSESVKIGCGSLRVEVAVVAVGGQGSCVSGEVLPNDFPKPLFIPTVCSRKWQRQELASRGAICVQRFVCVLFYFFMKKQAFTLNKVATLNLVTDFFSNRKPKDGVCCL